MGSRSASSVSLSAAVARAPMGGGRGEVEGLRSRRRGREGGRDVSSGSTNSSSAEQGLIARDFVAASHYHHHHHNNHHFHPYDGSRAISPSYGGGGCPSSSSSSSSSSSRGHIFENLVAALKVDYSVLRQGNSKHLLYRILDEAVDYLLPIARAYRTRVRLFQAHLHRNESKFTKVSKYNAFPPSFLPSSVSSFTRAPVMMVLMQHLGKPLFPPSLPPSLPPTS